VKSPLLWLMLNALDRFLLACEQCTIAYKSKRKKIADGHRQSADLVEIVELRCIKHELEDTLLGIDLVPFQHALQEEASKRYFKMTGYDEEEDREDYEFEYIDEFLKDHGWIFNKKIITDIMKKIKELYSPVVELDNLIKEKGFDKQG